MNVDKPPPTQEPEREPIEAGSDEDAANIAARVETRLDDLAQRFDRSDWIELFATVLLALATVVAAWSAYQATRWGGEQTVAFSEATAARAEGNETMTVAEAGLEIDVEMFSTWLEDMSSARKSATSLSKDSEWWLTQFSLLYG